MSQTLHSRAYVLPAADIDTDQVFPARFQSRVEKGTSLAPFFFHDRRFDATGAPTDSPLNRADLKGASILIAPRNYACGSARPGAIFAHRDFGIRILVSESFGQVFPTVCYKFGVVPIALKTDQISRLIDHLTLHPLEELTVDFAQGLILVGPLSLPFDLPPYVRRIAISGQDELSLTLSHLPAITRHEAGLPAWLTRPEFPS